MRPPPARVQPKGMLVDFGNTLLREGPVDVLAGTTAVLGHVAAPVCHTAEDLAQAIVRLRQDLEPRRRAAQLELPPYAVDRLIYQPRGIRFDVPEEQVEWTYWNAATSWTVESGAVEALRTVARAGIPCGVVSNTAFRAATIARELERHGFGGLFLWVLASSEHVVRKPHPLVFEVAARRLGVPPGDIWFVGDSLDNDIHGAAGAGMTPIWYDPDGADPRDRAPPGGYVITAWDEFPGLLA